MRVHLLHIVLILLFLGCKEKRETTPFLTHKKVRMAPPMIEVDSILFHKEARVLLKMDLEGSTITYGLGETTETNGTTYEDPISIDESASLWARAEHPDFLPSETTSLALYRIKRNTTGMAIAIAPSPHPNYPGEGAQILSDMRRGDQNFRKGKAWLGFQSGTVQLQLRWASPIHISKISIGFLADHSAWIFAPKKISVFSAKQKLGEQTVDSPTEHQSSQLGMAQIPIPESTYQELQLTIESLEAIPSWHQGKGTLPWLFLDEILIE
ncbi:MAG: hypothetical protein AB3N16_14730 [Flavobacteriaceae bacterium]